MTVFMVSPGMDGGSGWRVDAVTVTVAEEKAFEAVLWFGAILLTVGLAVAALMVVRRRSFSGQRETGTAFTLDELRRMHERGDVSPREYEALKRMLFRKSGE